MANIKEKIRESNNILLKKIIKFFEKQDSKY